MKIQKGIILSGGTGSRLYPLTMATNKQLLPIYDKPAIYYPLTTLMLIGIQDILIISTPRDIASIRSLLGDGSQLGMNFSYKIQEKPNGLPDAFIVGEKFIDGQSVAMILGDNFFHGHGLSEDLAMASKNLRGAHIFTHIVDDPHRYGVVVLDKNQNIIEIEEKPIRPKSNLAITGLYYFDGTVSDRAKSLKYSARNELEIVDLISSYLTVKMLSTTQLGRGNVWFDTGTAQSLLDASHYVGVIQSRQGIFIASPEEVAWRMCFIDHQYLNKNISYMPKSKYRDYLTNLISSHMELS